MAGVSADRADPALSYNEHHGLPAHLVARRTRADEERLMTRISQARRSTLATLGSALVLALTLAAPGADAQVKGGTLRVRLAGDLTSLDPAFNTTPPERHVLHQVLNTL